VFSLDTSVSVHEHQFHQQLTFVQNVISFFDVGESSVHVAVQTFGTDVYNEIGLDDYYNKDALMSHVGSVEYRGGGTNTALAILRAREALLEEHREHVPRLNIVVTDGLSLDAEQTAWEASVSKSRGIVMIAVGVGLGHDRNELLQIASFRANLIQKTGFYETQGLDEKLTFHVDDYKMLINFGKLLSSTMCQGKINVYSM